MSYDDSGNPVPPVHEYDSDVIHFSKLNPDTQRFGHTYTPVSELMTVCKASWAKRPRRAFRRILVTCPVCLALLPGDVEFDFNL